MSKVLYTFLKTWWGFQGPPITGREYKLPIIAHELYDTLRVPDDTTVILDEGDPDGYLLLDSVWQPICKYIGINPFLLGEFLINQRGLTYLDGFIPDTIKAFGGTHGEAIDTNGGLWYPDTSTSDNNIGFMYYANGYSTSQAGLGGTKYGQGYSVLANVIEPYQRDSAANNGVTYTFEIWRPEVIESGYINTQAFQTDDGKIRVGYLMINIWKLEDRYYYDIRLKSVNYSQGQTDIIINALNQEELEHVYNPENPLDNKQADGTEGGNGGFDNDSDPVDVPQLPSLDISDLGGINLYRVTAADVKALMMFLAANDPGNAIVKWFTNPIQGVVSLHVLPYPVEVVGSGAIMLLGTVVSGTAGYKIKQFQEWDLGAVTVPYGFGDNFLDYEPHSKISIYLPFIGIRQLDMDECVGKSIGVVYQFDNVSGACIAFIKIGSSVRYTFAGSCAIGIPISQTNWGQCYMAVATIAAGAITGGVSAAAGAMGGATSIGAVAGQTALGAGEGIAKASGLGAAIGKPTVSRSGAISGAASALGVSYPYLIIERVEKAKVSNPAPVIGLASGRTLPLSALSGFNIIEDIHLSGISATASELDEIERLLYQGVIF